jgi:hypothetical protein
MANKKNGHNGDKDPNLLTSTVKEGGLSTEEIEKMYAQDFQQADSSNYTKDFVDPGTETRPLMMRTVFAKSKLPDYQLVVKCFARYDKFGDKRHLDMLKNLLACAVSVNGRSRHELLMAKTNIIATNILEEHLEGFSRGKNKEKDTRVYVNNRRVKDNQENNDEG